MNETPEEIRQCPTCSGPMVEGYIGDHGDVGSVLKLKWHPGTPRTWSLLGLFKFEQKGVIDGISLAAYRCPACGHVEFVAS